MKKITTICLLIFCNYISFAQIIQQYQYFDGADTGSTSLQIIRDINPNNIWQIGKPAKVLFNSAATAPNVIVTDTINSYPINNTSVFSFKAALDNWGSIWALQWKQKLDMDKHHDGGIVEFSLDHGTSWQNAFNNPVAHNFYGYSSANKDTLTTGEYAFSGTDNNWRDIWFCIYNFSSIDSIYYRFTFKSDAVNENKEGWMIDDISAHITMMHIIKENEKSKYLNVYPTPTSGSITVETRKTKEEQIIQSIDLIGIDGRTLKHFGVSPSKISIDIGDLPNGTYYLKINSNLQKEVFPIILNK